MRHVSRRAAVVLVLAGLVLAGAVLKDLMGME